MNYYFITGSSRGIGKALADILLKKETNKVFGYGRNKAIEHPNYTHLTRDFTDPKVLSGLSFPKLPDAKKIILINNAGVINEILRLGKQQNASILQDIQVNLTAAIVLINSFLSQYQSLEIPRIILNVSSGAARRPVDAWGPYCASKSGVDMISEVVAEEQQFQAEKNRVRIFSVAPGVVDTAMQDQIRETDEADFSNLQRFIDLKKNNQLFSPEKSAELLLKFVQNPNQYNEVIADVRS